LARAGGPSDLNSEVPCRRSRAEGSCSRATAPASGGRLLRGGSVARAPADPARGRADDRLVRRSVRAGRDAAGGEGPGGERDDVRGGAVRLSRDPGLAFPSAPTPPGYAWPAPRSFRSRFRCSVPRSLLWIPQHNATYREESRFTRNQSPVVDGRAPVELLTGSYPSSHGAPTACGWIAVRYGRPGLRRTGRCTGGRASSSASSTTARRGSMHGASAARSTWPARPFRSAIRCRSVRRSSSRRCSSGCSTATGTTRPISRTGTRSRRS
jgi:hypothetical protein